MKAVLGIHTNQYWVFLCEVRLLPERKKHVYTFLVVVDRSLLQRNVIQRTVRKSGVKCKRYLLNLIIVANIVQIIFAKFWEQKYNVVAVSVFLSEAVQQISIKFHVFIYIIIFKRIQNNTSQFLKNRFKVTCK